MPLDSPKPNLDQLNRLGGVQAQVPPPIKKEEPIRPIEREPEPAARPIPIKRHVSFTPGDETDLYRGHGGDFYINEEGHRVPVK